MNTDLTFALSQAFGVAAIVARPAARYFQDKFPDTKNIRLSEVFPRGFTGASYALLDAPVPALIQGLASARAASLSKKWGEANKRAISMVSLAGAAIGTALMAEDAVDYLPFVGAAGGVAVDFQSQARYQRLPYVLYPALWGTVAVSKGNWAVLCSDIIATGILWKTVYNEDIKNASGQVNASFKEDWKAYWYGIMHNAPTGAEIKGQVSSAPGHRDLTEQYLEKLQTKNNPHFVNQDAVIERLKQQAFQPSNLTNS